MRKIFLLFAIALLCLNTAAGIPVSSTQTDRAAAQRKFSRRELEAKQAIEARLAALVEAMRRKDTATRLKSFAPDWTGKLKDGEVITVKDLEALFERQHRSIISVSDETGTVVDDIKLKGNEAIVHTSQRFIRTVPGSDDKTVEVRTSVTHREVWVKTDRGWLCKHIEELEQGPTFVNGAEIPQDRAGWKFVRIVWEKGVHPARAAFEEARRKNAEAVLFQEATLNNLGYRLMQKGRLMDAIEVFRLNTEAYPQSSNVWDSLAEAYMNKGERELAIKNYRKSLELDPKNANAAQMIEKLQKP